MTTNIDSLDVRVRGIMDGLEVNKKALEEDFFGIRNTILRMNPLLPLIDVSPESRTEVNALISDLNGYHSRLEDDVFRQFDYVGELFAHVQELILELARIDEEMIVRHKKAKAEIKKLKKELKQKEAQ